MFIVDIKLDNFDDDLKIKIEMLKKHIYLIINNERLI